MMRGVKCKITMSEGKLQKQVSKHKVGLSSRKSNVSTKKKAVKVVDRVMGCRHEIKYLISESTAQMIAQFIKPYISQDPYCKLQRGGAYPIVSLYLDSDDLGLCRESMTGQKNRFKLRIRSYTDEPDYPCFFEIKRRINVIIMKSRARIMQRNVTPLLSGMPLPPQDYNVDEDALKQFQLYVKSINARPTILIRYMRQAYEGESEYRVRVTFDRELCYKVTHLPEVTLNGRGWQRSSLTFGKVIMEVKFTGHYPPWLSRMVEYFDIQQQSISKYTTSIIQSCLLGFCAPQLEEDS